MNSLKDNIIDRYVFLLTSIFGIFDNNENQLGNVVINWLDNGVTTRNIITKDDPRNKIFSDNHVKKKKKNLFYIDRTLIEDDHNLPYYFLKKIILVKPDLEIIRTTLHLFNNNVFGIPISTLNQKQLDAVNFFHQNRDHIFKKRCFTLCQNILKEPMYITKRIPFELKFNIITKFHLIYIDKIASVVSDKKIVNALIGKSTGENTKVNRILSTVKTMKFYDDQIVKLRNEISSNVTIGKNERVSYVNLLDSMSHQLNNTMCKLRISCKNIYS